MTGPAALRPDHDYHASAQLPDGHDALFSIVEPIIDKAIVRLFENMHGIGKVETTLAQSPLALAGVECDFHMLPQTSEVNYCIYNISALPTPSIRRKHVAHILRDDPFMAPPKDAGEDIAIRRRRLRYRAWHRDTKEMDLVLGPFADAHLDGLAAPELDRLEALMDEEDTDLLKWVMGQEPVPADADADLLGQIIAYRLQTQ